MKIVHSHRQGYSLVEVLVAISILLIAIVGPMTIASKGLQNAQFARQQTAAVFLAQEGIEHVVRLREENGISDIADVSGDTWQWVDALHASCKDEDEGCGIDQNSSGDLQDNVATDCSQSPTRCLLYRKTDTSTGMNVYSYDSTNAEPTIYTRKITVIPDGSSESARVTSEVRWNATAFGAERSVSVDAYLYNIYEL